MLHWKFFFKLCFVSICSYISEILSHSVHCAQKVAAFSMQKFQIGRTLNARFIHNPENIFKLALENACTYSNIAQKHAKNFNIWTNLYIRSCCRWSCTILYCIHCIVRTAFNNFISKFLHALIHTKHFMPCKQQCWQKFNNIDL